MNRRKFLQHTTGAVTAMAVSSSPSLGARAVQWPIGCFNRPWTTWSYHVTGFCAKDCAAQKSDVMIQFGTGKVDFAGVFRTLKASGFDGPIMVECCKVGASAEETMTNARANREFLESVLAKV